MTGFSYTVIDEGYKLHFPEVLDINIPREYHVDEYAVINITPAMMDDLVDKLNKGEIKIHCDDINILKNTFKLTVDGMEKLKEIIEES